MAVRERWWLVATEEQTPVAYWTEKDARLVAKVRDGRVLGEYVPASQLAGAVEALRRAHEQLSKHDYKGPKQIARAMLTMEQALDRLGGR